MLGSLLSSAIYEYISFLLYLKKAVSLSTPPFLKFSLSSYPILVGGPGRKNEKKKMKGFKDNREGEKERNLWS